MDESAAPNPLVLVTWGVLVFDILLYFALKGCGWLANRVAARPAVNPRWVGAAGVLVFTLAASVYLASVTVHREAYPHLEPFDQGRYLGSTVSIALIPGILVLGVVAYRGRRKSSA